MTLTDVWQKAQNPIKTSIGETSYDTWFSHLKICETNPGVLTIQAPDEYFKNWIDERYRTIIERCLRTEAGQGIDIEFAVNSELLNKKTQQKLTSIEKSFAPADKNIHLNPRFLFDNFVVGAGNRFAFAAAQAVAENPAKSYNPFLFTGQWGWGKRICFKPLPMRPRERTRRLKYVTCLQSSSPMN